VELRFNLPATAVSTGKEFVPNYEIFILPGLLNVSLQLCMMPFCCFSFFNFQSTQAAIARSATPSATRYSTSRWDHRKMHSVFVSSKTPCCRSTFQACERWKA
jgi:hypothetical protein